MVCFQSKLTSSSKPFSKWLVYTGFVVSNTDRPYDPNKKDSFYPKLGDCSGIGINYCYHGHWYISSLFRFCKCLEDAAFTCRLFSLVNSYFVDLLFTYTGC